MKRQAGGLSTELRRTESGPLYARIARALKDEIIAGVYPVGSQLPTEDRLCERYDVSRHTVRDALRLLRDENLVVSRKRAGTIVMPPQDSDSNFVHAMSIDDLLAFSTRWQFTIETVAMTTPDPALAAWAGLAEGEAWLKIVGVARTHGSDLPECRASYHIHSDFASITDRLHDHAGGILPLIEGLSGQRVVEMVQEITATMIDPAQAESLQVEAGTPAIVARRRYMGADGKVMLVNVELYPASRFRYTTSLRREAGA